MNTRTILLIATCVAASITLNVRASETDSNKPTFQEALAKSTYNEFESQNALSRPVVSAWEQKTMKSEGGRTTEVVETWKVETRKFNNIKKSTNVNH